MITKQVHLADDVILVLDELGHVVEVKSMPEIMIPPMAIIEQANREEKYGVN